MERKRKPAISIRAAVFLLLVSMLSVLPVTAQELSPETLKQIRFEQKLNNQISLDLPFVDEKGDRVRLRDYFGKQPVILVLGYYRCPMLCSFVLDGLVNSLQDLKADAGNDFQIVYASIDPTDTPKLARSQKATFAKRYGRPGTEQGWHFLTGDKPSITTLAREVGFRFAYDPTVHQYAHPSGIVVATPTGRVARYFLGVKYSPTDLAASLEQASRKQIGSPARQLFLLCFCYNPITGKYSSLVMGVVRTLGILTMLGIAGLLFVAIRRSRRSASMDTEGGQQQV